MKVKPVSDVNPFNPITIEITIESEDELKELWYRLNVPNSIVKEHGGSFKVTPPFSFNLTIKLWRMIDSYLTMLGLKKEN
jgi:predicted SpoU family rRNA methylase